MKGFRCVLLDISGDNQIAGRAVWRISGHGQRFPRYGRVMREAKDNDYRVVFRTLEEKDERHDCQNVWVERLAA